MEVRLRARLGVGPVPCCRHRTVRLGCNRTSCRRRVRSGERQCPRVRHGGWQCPGLRLANRRPYVIPRAAALRKTQRCERSQCQGRQYFVVNTAPAECCRQLYFILITQLCGHPLSRGDIGCARVLLGARLSPALYSLALFTASNPQPWIAAEAHFNLPFQVFVVPKVI
jgi:hypothetical protein